MSKTTYDRSIVIPTEYNGIKFRSRLEARWAVFFDAIGQAWEYEPEGYRLSSDCWYLPDFAVLDGFFEVKPIEEWDSISKSLFEGKGNNDAVYKAAQLALATDRHVVIACGPPHCMEGVAVYREQEFAGDRANIPDWMKQGCFGFCGFGPDLSDPMVHEAAQKARGYRFWNPKGGAV